MATVPLRELAGGAGDTGGVPVSQVRGQRRSGYGGSVSTVLGNPEGAGGEGVRNACPQPSAPLVAVGAVSRFLKVQVASRCYTGFGG